MKEEDKKDDERKERTRKKKGERKRKKGEERRRKAKGVSNNSFDPSLLLTSSSSSSSSSAFFSKATNGDADGQINIQLGQQAVDGRLGQLFQHRVVAEVGDDGAQTQIGEQRHRRHVPLGVL